MTVESEVFIWRPPTGRGTAAEHGRRRGCGFKRPVGLLLIAVLHCIPDDENPRGIIDTLMDAFVPGSFPAITHPGIDQLPEQMKAAEQALTKSMG
ncbi:hypothetical protein GCM10009735_45930 [Actinomadura chokoriensis]